MHAGWLTHVIQIQFMMHIGCKLDYIRSVWLNVLKVLSNTVINAQKEWVSCLTVYIINNIMISNLISMTINYLLKEWHKPSLIWHLYISRVWQQKRWVIKFLLVSVFIPVSNSHFLLCLMMSFPLPQLSRAKKVHSCLRMF